MLQASFSYQAGSGCFFLPVEIPSGDLATGIINDTLENSLAPFQLALDRLIEARPRFDALLETAKRTFES